MVGDQSVVCAATFHRPDGRYATIDTTEVTSSAPATPSVRVRRPSRPRGQVEQFGDGRVCSAAGCTTILSRYNRDGLCWGHEQSARAARDAPKG